MDLAQRLTSFPQAGLRDGKRHAILKGAKAVFLKRGFGGATMDAVALRAGVAKMTVYRHFGSKEALFAGVITDLCERIVDDDLMRAFEGPPREALEVFARKVADIVFAPETIELHRIVVSESRRFPKLGRLFYETGPKTCIAALESYFRNQAGNTSVKVRDPRRGAEEFLELIRGYAHLRVLLGIEKSPSEREIGKRIEAAVRHVLSDTVNPR